MIQDMNLRTKQFAVDVWLLCTRFPHSREYSNYVNQLLRCSSSLGANYRTVGRAKSKADFINKLKIVEEEADESQFFLELLLKINSDSVIEKEIERLIREVNEIIAIVVSSLKSARLS
ncbi:four helix bundle protein [Algoriphagus sanaruensis]|uniref:Four helix bundle protein n=1 Tax=Algoriphagus sanaruensis TaxID=1727163 RepID=A0A142EMR5_9BACT|nr:four helix bundle protein [Algoriphagus sanaruensis]AMQ56420.1 four helix bundle protein [Algoriphagus sanaruensis]